MARIIVMPQVQRDVDAAETFPLSGPRLEGRFAPNRFVLGPWSWMILVYRYDEASDQVFLIAMFDARSSGSPLTP